MIEIQGGPTQTEEDLPAPLPPKKPQDLLASIGHKRISALLAEPENTFNKSGNPKPKDK